MEKVLRSYEKGHEICLTEEGIQEIKNSWMPSKFSKAIVRVENMKRRTLGNIGMTYNRVQVGSSRMEIEYLISELEMELIKLKD